MKKSTKTKRKNRKRKPIRLLVLIILLAIAAITGIAFAHSMRPKKIVKNVAKEPIPDRIDQQIIDEGNPSRNGKKLKSIHDIVIHYVGNSGSTAQQNHDYYCHSDSNVSSHFVVGLDGEIIMCLPLDEWSAASNNRNPDTISIEVCHPDDTGKFSKKTYKSLIKLVSWLLDICELDTSHVIRHYDITGKECPRYYVKNEDAWKKLLKDIDKVNE